MTAESTNPERAAAYDDCADKPESIVSADSPESAGAADGSSVLSDPSKQRLLMRVVLPLAVVLAVLVWVLATRDSALQRKASSPLLGKLTPALVGVTTGGESFDIDSWRGRWVLVNFFSTTCVPCVKEHPELVEFDERHSVADDARIVSITFADSAANVAEFFAVHGGDWPVLAEGSYSAAVAYGVTGVPESYLVAPSGVVVWKRIGGVTADAIDDIIERLTVDT